MTIPVWTYWEGSKPLFVDLCIRSIEACCRLDPQAEFHLLDKRTTMVAGLLNDEWRKLGDERLASRCLASAVLTKYGGVWLEADTVCFRSPTELAEALTFVYAQGKGWKAMPGYLYSPASSPVAQEWLKAFNSLLSNGPANRITVSDAITIHGNHATEVPRETFLPIDHDAVAAFFQPGANWRSHTTLDTIGFGLHHSYMMAQYREQMTLPPGRWAKSPLLIHQLLSYAAERYATPAFFATDESP